MNIHNKVKQRKIYKIDNYEDLNNFDFVKAIPKNAMSVEITCKNNNIRELILEIDYVLEAYSVNFKEGELYE